MDKHLLTWCLLMLLGQASSAVSEGKVYVNDNVNTGKQRGEGIVELTCYDGEWINIRDAHTSSCSGAYCTPDKAASLDTTLLAGLCTGVQRCTEDVSIPADAVKIEVRYQCLKVNPHNLCVATVSPVFYQNHVDIHTPRYPARQRDQCDVQCTVTGSLMYLTVYKSGGIHVRGLVNGFSTSLTPPQSYTDVSMFEFSYENTGMDDQGTWVRVSGNGARLQVDCKSSHSTTTVPGRSTPAQGVVGLEVEDTPTVDDDTFKPDINETDSDADDPESTLVGDLLGGLLALVVVVIIGVAVTVLFCKRKKSTGSPNNEDSLTQVNKLPDVPPRPSVRPQRPVPPQGNDDGYLTLVESTTQVNKPAVSSRPCQVPDEEKEDGYLTPMETTTQAVKPPNVPSQQRIVQTQGKEDNYLTPVESTTKVIEPSDPPRPAVRTSQVSDQGPEGEYLASGERSWPKAPLVYDKLEQPVYLELENPAENNDLDVYDTIGEAKAEEYTTPYSTS